MKHLRSITMTSRVMKKSVNDFSMTGRSFYFVMLALLVFTVTSQVCSANELHLVDPVTSAQEIRQIGLQKGTPKQFEEFDPSDHATAFTENLRTMMSELKQGSKTECHYSEVGERFSCVQLSSYISEEGRLLWTESEAFVFSIGVERSFDSGLDRETKDEISAGRRPVAESQELQASQGEANYISSPPSEASNTNDIHLIKKSTGIVSVLDDEILFTEPSQKKNVRLHHEVKKDFVSMFVRDSHVVSIDQTSLTLQALSAGTTELFVVSKDRISIVPIKVNQGPIAVAKTPRGPASLEVPSQLATLDILDRITDGITTGVRSTISALASAGKTLQETLTVPNELTKIGELVGDVSFDKLRFAHATQDVTLTKVYLRVVDDRSDWTKEKVYPVGGASVRLLGLDFEAQTDGQGFVELLDVPLNSRFFVEIRDPSNAIMPSFAEVYATNQINQKSKAQWIMVRRFVAFEMSQRLASSVQQTSLASYCGTVVDSLDAMSPLPSVQVATQEKMSGPYYLNQSGVIDSRLQATSSTGRFCFFNIQPGPFSIGFVQSSEKADRSMLTATYMVASGLHTEEVIPLKQSHFATNYISSIATATEQLSSDPQKANTYLPVEFAEVKSIGGEASFVAVDDGIIASPAPLLAVRGRGWTVAEASDQERSVQSIRLGVKSAKPDVLALIPRGFVEDMMFYAQSDHDLNLSSIVVEYAHQTGVTKKTTKIRLVDTAGQAVGDGWSYADDTISKAIFFNVEPGVYTVHIETDDGQWLSSDTLLAYPETSTVVKLGSKLKDVNATDTQASLD